MRLIFCRDLKAILSIIIIIGNIGFCIYSLYYVARYIIEFRKTRDYVLAGIGGIVIIAMNVFNVF